MTCMHKIYARKRHILHTGKKTEMMCSVGNFGLGSKWDVMRRVRVITTVFIILHWSMSQHAMRSSTNDVSYHREKQSSGTDAFKTGTEMRVHTLVYAPKPRP